MVTFFEHIPAAYIPFLFAWVVAFAFCIIIGVLNKICYRKVVHPYWQKYAAAQQKALISESKTVKMSDADSKYLQKLLKDYKKRNTLLNVITLFLFLCDLFICTITIL